MQHADYCIGIDLHKHVIQACVVDAMGGAGYEGVSERCA